MRWNHTAQYSRRPIACRWLIRKFIDPQAEFPLIDPNPQTLKHCWPHVDRRGAEYGHEGRQSTFQVCRAARVGR